MKSRTLAEVFATIDRQRHELYERLADISPAELWRRTEEGRWSIGQNLEHLAKTMRICRRVYALAIRIEWPLANLLRRRPFPSRIENLFEGRLKRMPAPPGFRPRDRQRQPRSLDELRDRLDAERARLAALLEGIDEDLAGHITLAYPPVGVVNLLQDAWLIAYHEAHHLRFVHTKLDAQGG